MYWKKVNLRIKALESIKDNEYLHIISVRQIQFPVLLEQVELLHHRLGHPLFMVSSTNCTSKQRLLILQIEENR